MIQRRTPLTRSPLKARTAKPKPVNTARRKREKARTNGSPERDAFVRSLRCCACGVHGFSEVAHVGKAGKGAGRKANADQTAPLCGPRAVFKNGLYLRTYLGCHRASHGGQQSFEKRWGIDLLECAAETERLWQAACGAS